MERIVSLLDQVPHPELQGVHFQPASDAVDVGLEGERGLRLAGRSHMSARYRVGVDLNGLYAAVRNPVWARGAGEPRQVNPWLEAAVQKQVRIVAIEPLCELDLPFGNSRSNPTWQWRF